MRLIFLRLVSFLLTHLMRGATEPKFVKTNILTISTHTPHARCDTERNSNFCRAKISTHTPHARCDQNTFDFCASFVISTHTPHARCDGLRHSFPNRCLIFLLTHLMRGATNHQKSRTQNHLHFYSHTSCEVRQSPETR